ncbi:hypothetical protein C8R43DRAFT_948056 [Mycena crocata]|nr:hypothetical protein C8R43DRAFT_948056 [Mycena crocata]
MSQEARRCCEICSIALVGGVCLPAAFFLRKKAVKSVKKWSCCELKLRAHRRSWAVCGNAIYGVFSVAATGWWLRKAGDPVTGSRTCHNSVDAWGLPAGGFFSEKKALEHDTSCFRKLEQEKVRELQDAGGTEGRVSVSRNQICGGNTRGPLGICLRTPDGDGHSTPHLVIFCDRYFVELRAGLKLKYVLPMQS